MSKKDFTRLVDVTPAEHQCGIGACPAVFRSDVGTYVLVGRLVPQHLVTDHLANSIGSDEVAIEIPAAILDKRTSTQ